MGSMLLAARLATVARVTALVALSAGACSRPGDLPELVSNLDDANLAVWQDHIWPRHDELGFEQIAWLPSFHEGLRAADAQDKPLLVWVMNGHPLGCT